MTYIADRLVYDADSHVMELADWLEPFADAATAAKLRPLYLGAAGALADTVLSASAVAHYASIVRDYAQRRMLQTTADSLASAWLDRRIAISDALDHAEQLLFSRRVADTGAGVVVTEIEARQKLAALVPATLAQASRIPGVSPSDLQNLVLEIERRRGSAR